MRSLTIQIPQPCHERWADMQPIERGRFCASCQKTVVDYTAFSDQELVRLLAKASETSCGRFHDEQLNRPLLPSNSGTAPTWRHWLGLVTMGLFGWQTARAQPAQTGATARPASVQQTPVVADDAVASLPARSNLDPDQKWVISGRIMHLDSSGNISPVAKAYIFLNLPYTDALAGHSRELWQTQTDSAGAFTLLVPMQRQVTALTGWASSLHNRPQKITVNASPSSPSISLSDIILHQQATTPRQSITGGGLLVTREPSRWQKLKRKLFR